MQRSRAEALQTTAKVITALVRPHPARMAIRPELRNCWDVAVLVDVDASVAIERGKARDAALLGGEEVALALYRDRYAGAFEIYEAISQPKLNAHIVIENGTFSSATVHVQKPVK
jgi:hypothetical protein